MSECRDFARKKEYYMRFLSAILILGLVGCGAGHFTLSKTQYTKSPHVTNDAGAAKAALLLLGYEIEKSNWEVTETKVERIYMGRGNNQVEFQTWIKVYTNAGMIKAYCTQRRMGTAIDGKERAFRLHKCTSPPILERVNVAVETLKDRLALGL